MTDTKDPLHDVKLDTDAGASSQVLPSERLEELEEMPEKELRAIASQLDIPGRSKMDKDDLALAILAAEQEAEAPPSEGSEDDEEELDDEEGDDSDSEEDDLDEEGEEEKPKLGKDAPPVEPPSSAAMPERGLWEVQNQVTIGWGGGRILKLAPGTQVGVHTHGTHCVERMRNGGVRLNPLNDAARKADREAGYSPKA